MEINAAQRKLEICKLSEFLSSAKNQVDSLVSSLGWTTDNLKKSEIKYNCPYNPGHVICSKTANEHISKCYLKSQGYKLDEAFLCEPKIESNNSVKIDHALKIQILNHTRSTQHDFKQEKIIKKLNDFIIKYSISFFNILFQNKILKDYQLKVQFNVSITFFILNKFYKKIQIQEIFIV
ncbi:unnamed protein product [Brassicogethes aeneus]|uniref:CHHC U11-48K-type domain-containing protein n=1 Tax=Brassicogethes aeneus TaxID=1431903 RepID=A0A9P0FHL2_BRAAE|nr:unnamed protein product [Brassicogethes aeneus]